MKKIELSNSKLPKFEAQKVFNTSNFYGGNGTVYVMSSRTNRGGETSYDSANKTGNEGNLSWDNTHWSPNKPATLHFDLVG